MTTRRITYNVERRTGASIVASRTTYYELRNTALQIAKEYKEVY